MCRSVLFENRFVNITSVGNIAHTDLLVDLNYFVVNDLVLFENEPFNEKILLFLCGLYFFFFFFVESSTD